MIKVGSRVGDRLSEEIQGEVIDRCGSQLQVLWDDGVTTTVDVSQVVEVSKDDGR